MINSVQYLRGIAALAVVIYHASQALFTHFSINQEVFLSWGNAGVDLFFIISGFIMVYITYNKKVNIKNFFFKRAIRIYPIFWVYVTIALAIFLINPDMINRSSSSPTLVLPSYLLIPYTEFTNLVLVAWTLIYEIHFYLIFAFSLIFSNTYRYICTGLILSIGALSSFINHEFYYLNFITNPIILEFLLGMIVYFIIFKREDRLTLASLTALLISSTTLLFFNELLPERVLYYGAPAFILMLIVLQMESKKIIGNQKGKGFQFLKVLGDSSYSLYLSHIFCIGAGLVLLRKLDVVNDYTYYISVFTIAFGCVLWGYISYKFIETPLINKINSIFFRPKKIETETQLSKPTAN